ncbi:MAG: hypothetical protein KGJ60_11575 [Verrucomicrobiota bacterium]|nr:hypothetical protein [Verrucomicrobiota bacterium]
MGVGAAVIPAGKGEVVLFNLPALKAALAGEAADIHPLVAQRILLNGLARQLRGAG